MKRASGSPDIPDVAVLPRPVKVQAPREPGRNLQSLTTYKGGRKLRYAERFRIWREVQGLSRGDVAKRLHQVATMGGINIEVEYLHERLEEFDNGRHKPPTWLVLLILQAYAITLPWNDFWDGGNQ